MLFAKIRLIRGFLRNGRETCRGVCFYARDERATSAARAIARIVSERLGEFVERGAGDGGAEQFLQLGSVGE